MKLILSLSLLLLAQISWGKASQANDPCANGKHHSYACQTRVFEMKQPGVPVVSPYYGDMPQVILGVWNQDLRVFADGRSFSGQELPGPDMTLFHQRGQLFGGLSHHSKPSSVLRPDNWTVDLRFEFPNREQQIYQCRYFERGHTLHKLCRLWVNGRFDGYVGYRHY